MLVIENYGNMQFNPGSGVEDILRQYVIPRRCAPAWQNLLSCYCDFRTIYHWRHLNA